MGGRNKGKGGKRGRKSRRRKGDEGREGEKKANLRLPLLTASLP